MLRMVGAEHGGRPPLADLSLSVYPANVCPDSCSRGTTE